MKKHCEGRSEDSMLKQCKGRCELINDESTVSDDERIQ